MGRRSPLPSPQSTPSLPPSLPPSRCLLRGGHRSAGHGRGRSLGSPQKKMAAAAAAAAAETSKCKDETPPTAKAAQKRATYGPPPIVRFALPPSPREREDEDDGLKHELAEIFKMGRRLMRGKVRGKFPFRFCARRCTNKPGRHEKLIHRNAHKEDEYDGFSLLLFVS